MRQGPARTLLTFLMIALLIAGCKPGNEAPAPTATQPQASAETLPPPVVHLATQPPTSPESQPAPNPSPAPAAGIQPAPGPRTHYELQVNMDYYSRYANVVQKISYTNTTGSELSQIPLHVPPLYFPGAFNLGSLSTQPASTYRQQEQTIWLDLASPLSRDALLEIDVVFRLVMPNQAATFGATDQQTNLVNWYPYIPAYLAEKGFIMHAPVYDNTKQVYVGEYIVNDLADFDVSLSLSNRPELIEVAASAEAQGEPKSGKYRYHLEAARGFAFSISDSYFIHEVQEGAYTIRSYSFINHENAGTGEAVLPIAAQAMRLFEDLLYPYQRDLISIVVADYLHNMEMDGMVMLSYGVFDFFDQTPKNNLTILTPHELSHQWFYSVVGNDQALEPWLDESIATYSELLYYERYHPDLVSWWWDQRVDVHNPSGYVNPSTENSGGYDAYRNGVYLQGARFLQELRGAMGDAAFFAALKDYASAMAWKLGTRADFEASFARHSSTDLAPIYAKYFIP